jgi:hypothetical protein
MTLRFCSVGSYLYIHTRGRDEFDVLPYKRSKKRRMQRLANNRDGDPTHKGNEERS